LVRLDSSATEASRRRVAIAERVAAAYVAHTEPRAILLTGSVAEGISDRFSDIDLIAYSDELPSASRRAAARGNVGATDARSLSHVETDSFLDVFVIQGVECQVGCLTVAGWQRDMASVLENHTPATNVEKAIIGLLAGTALHGSDLIGQWQSRAAIYPEALAQATVAHYLRFFPLWREPQWWNERDATIFHHQLLVETSVNLLGVLAGLNHLYFSSFQFKRLRRFVGRMRFAPERFADRLDGLFALGPVEAGAALERLVTETVALAEAYMPEVDTAAVRRQLGSRRRGDVAG
jgi:predicted nucleotidyltransferase